MPPLPPSCRLLDKVELQVDDTWLHQVRHALSMLSFRLQRHPRVPMLRQGAACGKRDTHTVKLLGCEGQQLCACVIASSTAHNLTQAECLMQSTASPHAAHAHKLTAGFACLAVQLRLSACPERAARLLMAARETPGGAPASSSSGAAALTYPQQPRKISTPNREQAGAAKVPLLKLGSSGSAAAAAMPALGSAKENQQQQAPLQQQAAAAVLPAVVTGPAVLTSSPVKGAQDPKSRSMVFLPKKVRRL